MPSLSELNHSLKVFCVCKMCVKWSNLSKMSKMYPWDQSQTSIMETGTSPRELFWVSGTGPREQSGPRIIDRQTCIISN